jgi:hypothetical protein
MRQTPGRWSTLQAASVRRATASRIAPSGRALGPVVIGGTFAPKGVPGFGLIYFRHRGGRRWTNDARLATVESTSSSAD